MACLAVLEQGWPCLNVSRAHAQLLVLQAAFNELTATVQSHLTALVKANPTEQFSAELLAWLNAVRWDCMVAVDSLSWPSRERRSLCNSAICADRQLSNVLRISLASVTFSRTKSAKRRSALSIGGSTQGVGNSPSRRTLSKHCLDHALFSLELLAGLPFQCVASKTSEAPVHW
jgi:hypothetical protein